MAARVVVAVFIGRALLAENLEAVDGGNVGQRAFLWIKVRVRLEQDVREAQAKVSAVDVQVLLSWHIPSAPADGYIQLPRKLLASRTIGLYRVSNRLQSGRIDLPSHARQIAPRKVQSIVTKLQSGGRAAGRTCFAHRKCGCTGFSGSSRKCLSSKVVYVPSTYFSRIMVSPRGEMMNREWIKPYKSMAD